MTKDRYKQQFAETTAEAFRVAYPDVYEQLGDNEPFDSAAILKALTTPRDAGMGRFALPVFKYARALKAKPPDIAVRVAEETNRLLEKRPDRLIKSVALSGFLNAQVDPLILARETLDAVLTRGTEYGQSQLGNDMIYLVEYSSPNIAKPFGVGHLRSTILGHTLRRIYRKLGYNVVGINYPGDWGTQFGKMIVAYEKWGDEKTLEGNAVKNLLALYVRYHEEAEKDDKLDDKARLAFKRLEDGNPEAVRLWKTFKEISYAEFDRVYGLLGIEFDWVYGESDLNDKMEPLVRRLERDGLTSVSQGALVVELNDKQLPPLLLKKADGATLYATRDLTGMVYRWDRYPGFYESLYVVNTAQSDHFKQCFRVIDMMEETEKIPSEKRMGGRLRHVDFGWVRFGGKSMSTRRGNIVLLEDVIAEATDLARGKIREKNPGLERIDETARMIGVGAVVFSQLSVRRQRDVDFQWEEVLSFEGETGPYLQYTHARLCSLLRKYDGQVSTKIDHARLNAPEEQRVIEALADFPEVVVDAGEHYEPNFIAAYLLRLAGAFNKVYQRKDDQGNIDKIISDDLELTAARIALVRAVQLVIGEGLYLLGLQAPEEM